MNFTTQYSTHIQIIKFSTKNYLVRGGKETLSSLEACTSGGIQTEDSSANVIHVGPAMLLKITIATSS